MTKLLYPILFMLLLVSCSSDDSENGITPVTDESLYQYWPISTVFIDGTWIQGINDYYFDFKKDGTIRIKDKLGEAKLTFEIKKSHDGYNDSIITSDPGRRYKLYKRTNNYEIHIEHTLLDSFNKPAKYLYSCLNIK